MFTSQANGTTKKIFKKPNILRRKPKPKREALKYTVPPDGEPHTVLTLKDKPANINSITITRELYPLLDHEEQCAVVCNAAACTDNSDQLLQVHKKKYLGSRYSIAQSVETTNEIYKASEEGQATLSQDEQNNSFFKHALYKIKPSILLEQQKNCK